MQSRILTALFMVSTQSIFFAGANHNAHLTYTGATLNQAKELYVRMGDVEFKDLMADFRKQRLSRANTRAWPNIASRMRMRSTHVKSVPDQDLNQGLKSFTENLTPPPPAASGASSTPAAASIADTSPAASPDESVPPDGPLAAGPDDGAAWEPFGPAATSSDGEEEEEEQEQEQAEEMGEQAEEVGVDEAVAEDAAVAEDEEVSEDTDSPCLLYADKAATCIGTLEEAKQCRMSEAKLAQCTTKSQSCNAKIKVNEQMKTLATKEANAANAKSVQEKNLNAVSTAKEMEHTLAQTNLKVHACQDELSKLTREFEVYKNKAALAKLKLESSTASRANGKESPAEESEEEEE